MLSSGGHQRKNYVILPRGEDDRLPPRTLVMDVTMTHDRYGRTTQRTKEALTHRVSSTVPPQPDGTLKFLNKGTRIKIRHYRQMYVDRPDPIVFLPVAVNIRVESMRTLYDYFSYTWTVKLVFWPENYLRNRISFVSCELHVWLILKSL